MISGPVGSNSLKVEMLFRHLMTERFKEMHGEFSLPRALL